MPVFWLGKDLRIDSHRVSLMEEMAQQAVSVAANLQPINHMKVLGDPDAFKFFTGMARNSEWLARTLELLVTSSGYDMTDDLRKAIWRAATGFMERDGTRVIDLLDRVDDLESHGMLRDVLEPFANKDECLCCRQEWLSGNYWEGCGYPPHRR